MRVVQNELIERLGGFRGQSVMKELLHQVFQVHYVHEILHLLSGVVGSFLGTWGYFRMVNRKGETLDD